MSIRDRRCGRIIACFPRLRRHMQFNWKWPTGTYNTESTRKQIWTRSTSTSRSSREISLAGKQKEWERGKEQAIWMRNMGTKSKSVCVCVRRYQRRMCMVNTKFFFEKMTLKPSIHFDGLQCVLWMSCRYCCCCSVFIFVKWANELHSFVNLCTLTWQRRWNIFFFAPYFLSISFAHANMHTNDIFSSKMLKFLIASRVDSSSTQWKRATCTIQQCKPKNALKVRRHSVCECEIARSRAKKLYIEN